MSDPLKNSSEIPQSTRQKMHVMDTPSPSIQDLAQRLLALETARQSGSDPHGHEGLRVCEKLRISLTRFAGPEAFTAILRRALALARADVAALQSVKINAEGRLEGLKVLGADTGNVSTEAAFAITAHLLGLLATFIGEPLTLRLVHEVWPKASLDE